MNVLGEAMHYYHSAKKFSEIIQSFVCNTFKPMIDYINDAISMEMIVLEAETKLPVPTVYQTIENNYGKTGQDRQERCCEAGKLRP